MGKYRTAFKEGFRQKRRELTGNDKAAVSAKELLVTIVSIVAGLYAVAYVLPPGMAALGQTNTSGWPAGTEAFIVPIGVFVMIGLLILFAFAVIGKN